jgi:hypothetical protein
MPEKAKDGVNTAPELAEKADAIARGRELVKQVQRSAEALDRQVEQAQATIEQSDRILDRSQQLLRDKPREPFRAPASSGSGSDGEA